MYLCIWVKLLVCIVLIKNMGEMFEIKSPVKKREVVAPELSERNKSVIEKKFFESEFNLSDAALCFRVFKIGNFNENSLEQFKNQVASIRKFNQTLRDRLGEKAPHSIIITNANLGEDGRRELDSSGLEILFTDPAKAKRRASLARHLIGEKSSAKGEFSYSDMLNEPIENKDFSKFFFVSSDLTNKPEELLQQILGMEIIKRAFEETHPEKLAIVGSAVEGVHVIEMVNKIIKGEEALNMENISQIFHNNALSQVGKDAKFSGIADNALAGKVEINEKLESIGGNEDFLYGLKEIIYHKRDCVLLIDPYIAGERKGEVKAVDSKYLRRAAVYKLYAERAIKQASKRDKIDLDNEILLSEEKMNEIISDAMDKHLFFSRINQEGLPEIILTSRQLSKGILAPI